MVHYFLQVKELRVLNIYIWPKPEELQPTISIHYVQISMLTLRCKSELEPSCLVQ